MQTGLLLAQQILQLFIVLLLGYVLVRSGLLKAADSRVLSVIMVYIVLPCVILNAFQIDDTPEIRAGLLYALAAAAAVHLLFLLLTLLLRGPLRLDEVERATVIYSNAGALVIPLVQALLGQEYVIYSCAFIIVQLVLLWTHGAFILQGGGKLSLKSILGNVNLISIAAGMLLYFTHCQLPAIIGGTMSSLSAMVGPIGMLLAGMAIAESPLGELFCNARSYLSVLLRLVLYPLAALALMYAVHILVPMPDDKGILMTVYLAAITPACATVTSMAQLYGRASAHASALYVLSTLLSIITMPVMISLFDIIIV